MSFTRFLPATSIAKGRLSTDLSVTRFGRKSLRSALRPLLPFQTKRAVNMGLLDKTDDTQYI